MSTALADKTELRIPAPELRGASWEVGSCRDTEVCLDGPGGCVAGETLFYNPVTGEHTPIKELYKKRIAPIVQTLMGAIQADVPFRKGVECLYRVTLVSGRQCIVTANHRFLTPDGWRFASACEVGSHLLVSSPCPRPTTEVLGPSVSPQDALRLSQTPSGSQESYLVSHQGRDEQPQLVEDSALASAPSRADVHERSRVGLCEGDRGISQGYIHQGQQSDHHARRSYPLAYTDQDTVSSIEYERTDEYFDLHVPIAEHYLAEGIWHHNTGKTYGILYKIHTLLLSYPGAKWLVCRKFNVDLAGSAMATYQNDVLHPSENVTYYGGSKVKPAGYNYPNGSFLAVSGLDRPSKLKSFECDGVYINEATEVDIDDLEIARMRLRKGVIPYQQVLMDTNPDAPTHWLNQRMNEGRTTRLISRHEDNPRYWNNRTQDWTDEGYKYIFGILGGLTGVRYARYRLGLWVAAEGTVYEDSWDRARNVIDRFPIPREWPRYLCIDFGYTNPFVCAWWAMDPDGRLFCYREIYHTKRLVEDHAKQIKHYSQWGLEGGDPLPREIICDHDAEDRATLERHLGLITRPAHKSVRDGIQAMAARLRPAGDGKPRLMYFRDALVERDQELSRQKKPTCTIEEPESYVWAQTTTGIKEEPVKENDHGLDSARYMVARFDLQPSGVTYYKDIWR